MPPPAAPSDASAATPEPPDRRLGTIVAVVVLVVALVGLGLVVRARSTAGDGPDSAFVVPEAQWRTFTPEDQSFRAFLPGEPTATAVEVDLGNGPVDATRYEATEGPDTITMLVADLATVPTFAELAARTAALDGGTASTPAELSITGFPAADWTITRSDGSGVTVTRAIRSGTRLFVVQVRGPEPPRVEIDRVLSGFVPTS